MRFIIHLIIFFLLTIISQVGGIFFLISILLINKKRSKYKIKRIILFAIIYSLFTFIIIPKVAPYFGRVKIEENNNLSTHNFATKLLNRNYVNPKMNVVLNDISQNFSKEFPKIKITYLDANFPFFDGFPLLPHLSHNDGKKIDLSFIYKDENNKVSNNKPSISGYGIFVEPSKNEINQTKKCLEKKYWQYDFTKHLSFGTTNHNLKLSIIATKNLIENILANQEVSKIFIEPHLRRRLKLQHSKIRFHGCKAVRHDDHIHFQIK